VLLDFPRRGERKTRLSLEKERGKKGRGQLFYDQILTGGEKKGGRSSLISSLVAEVFHEKRRVEKKPRRRKGKVPTTSSLRVQGGLA